MTGQAKWLIERDIFLDGNPEKMAEIIRGKGMECRLVRYVEGEPVRSFADGECVVIYGSMGFVRDLTRMRRWRPTAWFDEQKLACHYYYGFLGKHVLQREYQFLPLGELYSLRASLYDQLGEADNIFIRPDDNMKSFAGGLVEQSKFEQWYRQNVRCYDLQPSLLCLVARPQHSWTNGV